MVLASSGRRGRDDARGQPAHVPADVTRTSGRVAGATCRDRQRPRRSPDQALQAPPPIDKKSKKNGGHSHRFRCAERRQTRGSPKRLTVIVAPAGAVVWTWCSTPWYV